MIERFRSFWKNESDKLEGKTARQKAEYVWEYYWLWIVGISFAVFMIIFTVYRATTAVKDHWFYLMLADTRAEVGNDTELWYGYVAYSGYDPAEKNVEFNDEAYFDYSKNHAAGNFCKLYISPKSEFELDGKVILNSRNLRLIRRMVRDYHFRSSDAVNTMKMWKHVVAGEDIYVRPFRTTADFWIDSTHDYEPMIFHHDLLPIASEVPKDSPYYETVMGLKTALDHFYDLDKSVVPAASLLHEFIG